MNSADFLNVNFFILHYRSIILLLLLFALIIFPLLYLKLNIKKLKKTESSNEYINYSVWSQDELGYVELPFLLNRELKISIKGYLKLYIHSIAQKSMWLVIFISSLIGLVVSLIAINKYGILGATVLTGFFIALASIQAFFVQLIVIPGVIKDIVKRIDDPRMTIEPLSDGSLRLKVPLKLSTE